MYNLFHCKRARYVSSFWFFLQVSQFSTQLAQSGFLFLFWWLYMLRGELQAWTPCDTWCSKHSGSDLSLPELHELWIKFSLKIITETINENCSNQNTAWQAKWKGINNILTLFHQSKLQCSNLNSDCEPWGWKQPTPVNGKTFLKLNGLVSSFYWREL